jgi:hypothetical protein
MTLSILASVLKSLKLNIANNSFHLFGRDFRINHKIAKIISRQNEIPLFMEKKKKPMNFRLAKNSTYTLCKHVGQ